MGPVAALERRLAWEGCRNVRDLGGLETASGDRTRRRALVRADNLRALTRSGWRAALAHGVGTIVDLRFPSEVADDPQAADGIDLVAVPLLDAEFVLGPREHAFLRQGDDVAAALASLYRRTLEQRTAAVATALAAVADAPEEHCVAVHCVAGKDRTGIVSALLLALAAVPDGVIADDYAESEQPVMQLFAGWLASADDEAQRTLRRGLCSAPRDAMTATLEWLHAQGGAEAYLLDAGLAPPLIARLRTRLLD